MATTSTAAPAFFNELNLNSLDQLDQFLENNNTSTNQNQSTNLVNDHSELLFDVNNSNLSIVNENDPLFSHNSSEHFDDFLHPEVYANMKPEPQSPSTSSSSTDFQFLEDILVDTTTPTGSSNSSSTSMDIESDDSLYPVDEQEEDDSNDDVPDNSWEEEEDVRCKLHNSWEEEEDIKPDVKPKLTKKYSKTSLSKSKQSTKIKKSKSLPSSSCGKSKKSPCSSPSLASCLIPLTDDPLDKAIYKLFPMHVLRLERAVFNKWKKDHKTRKLTSDEARQLARIRRTMLARVYAERARQRRDTDHRDTKNECDILRAEVERLQAMVGDLTSKNKRLVSELGTLKK